MLDPNDYPPRAAVLDRRNRRVKLFEATPPELENSLAFAPALLRERDPAYTKLVVYARPGNEGAWGDLALRREAVIRGFFADSEDAWLWAAYAPGSRAHERDAEALDRALEVALTKEPTTPALPSGLTCRPATPDDAKRLANLLRSTFSDYPTQITESALAGALGRGAVRFRMILDAEGSLLSTASAEIDAERQSAEMTDCATLPEARGRGLVAYALHRLERDLIEVGISDLYTIARAAEIGMNCAFRKLAYDYTGRLVKNCRMPGGWESMNVWCKKSKA